MKTTKKRWNSDFAFALLWIVLAGINLVKTATLIQEGQDVLSTEVAGNFLISLGFECLAVAYLFKMRRSSGANPAAGNEHIQDQVSSEKADA